MAIVHLDYQTFRFKKAYESSYPEKVVSKERVVRLMSDNPQYEWWEDWGVDEKKVELIGPYYIYSYPPGDFGGILIVNKNVDELIFSATTVWDGTGRLIIPATD